MVVPLRALLQARLPSLQALGLRAVAEIFPFLLAQQLAVPEVV
jgi:hypothetical protein